MGAVFALGLVFVLIIMIILFIIFIIGLVLLIVGLVNKQRLKKRNIIKNWPIVLIIVGSEISAIPIIIFAYFFIVGSI